MPDIFISYRRADSIGITERIHDRLSDLYGDKHVFKDVGDIRPGRDFRAVLSQELKKADVLLVMIGPQWFDIKDEKGQRRLDDPQDFVRFEVETGLARPDMLVIPVLVHGGQIPGPGVLPPSLEDLRYRNAVVVRNDPDFRHDLQALIDVINAKKPSRLKWLALVAVLLILAAAAAFIVPTLGNQNASTATPTEQITPTASPTEAAANPTDTAQAVDTAPPTTMPTEDASTSPEGETSVPQGYPLHLLYDEDSFYIFNPGDRQIRSENISFEGLSANSTTAGKRFGGIRWSELYPRIEPNQCVALEIVEAARHLNPSQCTEYNAVRTPPRASDEIFWTGDNIAAFRVLWAGNEIAQCPADQRECIIFIP